MKDSIIQYTYTDNILDDAKTIIEQARTIAFKAVDTVLVQRNWFLGQRIAIEELKGKK